MGHLDKTRFKSTKSEYEDRTVQKYPHKSTITGKKQLRKASVFAAPKGKAGGSIPLWDAKESSSTKVDELFLLQWEKEGHILKIEHMSNCSIIQQGGISMKKQYEIYVDCAACGVKMEGVLKNIAGINDAQVNYMLQKVTIDFEEGADEAKLLKNALKLCRKKVDDDIEIKF